jgi:hypothetical protein
MTLGSTTQHITQLKYYISSPLDNALENRIEDHNYGKRYTKDYSI